MRNFKIRKKLLISYATIVGLLVITSVVSILCLLYLGNEVSTFYNGPFIVSGAANIVNERFEGMQKAVYRAISNEDAGITSAAIQDAKDAATIIQEQIPIIKENFLGDISIVEGLEAKLAELAPMRETVLDMAANNQNEEAAQYMEQNNILVITEAQEYLDTLIGTANTKAEGLISTIQSVQTCSVIIMIILGVTSVGISFAFAKVITQGIVEPIKEIEEAAKNLERGVLEANIAYESEDERGNLSNSMRTSMTSLGKIIKDMSFLLEEIAKGNFTVKSKDETTYVGQFAPMLQAVRNMNENLSDTIRNINETSEQVALGSAQMAENAQGLAEGASDQASSVEELNATIDNIADMSERSADATKQAFTRVTESVKIAEGSRNEMGKLLEAMERINATSKEISNIITEIEDIASQTNLLSLNASIEAARAGEAGKGFAVVADQIGKLASDSAQSAVNTRELIGKTLQEIAVGNQIADNTSQSFENVIEEMKGFADVAKDTSEKSGEQYESLRQIKEGMDQISAIVQNNSAAAEETSATSQELAAQSDNLKSLISHFKLVQI